MDRREERRGQKGALRCYRRWDPPRLVLHDGERWRRVSEPWSIDRELPKLGRTAPNWPSLDNTRDVYDEVKTFLRMPGRRRVPISTVTQVW